MSSIVYKTNPKTGTVYAYESFSYRDPVTKRPTSRSTYLGRVDPVTKVIVEKAPAGKRNRSKLTTEGSQDDLVKDQAARIEALEEQVRSLQSKLDKLQSQSKDAISSLKTILKIASDVQLDAP